MTQLNKVFMLKLNKVDDSKAMLQLIDTVNESVRNLKTLGLESNALSDLIFVNFMLTKLDDSIKQRWELSLESNQVIPDLQSFRAFLEREAMSQTKIERKYGVSQKINEGNNFKKSSSVNNAIVVKDNKCAACGQNHQLFKCQKFKTMNVHDRWKLINSKTLCQNCLRDNHSLNTCRISIKCKVCNLPHHSSLHIFQPNSANQSSNHVLNSGQNSVQSVSNNIVCNSVTENYNVLLSTALIKVKSHEGKIISCRALIDNASQNSLISKECAESLNLPLISTTHRLVGVNGISAETCLNRTTLEYSPYFSNKFNLLNALVVNKVTTPLPNFLLTKVTWPHIQNLKLADPQFYRSRKIDLLLGADVFAHLINGAPIFGPPGEPCAIPTNLGYLLTGQIYQSTETVTHLSVSCHSIDLKEFFELESVPQFDESNKSDPAEQLYTKTTFRNEEGRYVVKLPLKENYSLGDSANQAFSSFKYLEKKFGSDFKLKRAYTAFMNEYAQLNHMTLVNSEDLNVTPNYYLPHHAVTNDNSTTTKLRVVFNASAKTSNGHSLNSNLLKGPKLQTNIFSHLLKFRLHKVALSSDIEKMYRQILIADEDTQFQRIFWRSSSSNPLYMYQLKTVTYGTCCAPFLALRTIKQLLSDEKDNFPSAVKAAQNHMYVDDFLGGTDSIESAKILVTELQNLFNSGGFHLRKWTSNYPEALAHLPESLKSTTSSMSFNPDSEQRVLGLEWNLAADTLRVQVCEEDTVKTKRQLLSIIARIFDPLGLLSPSTVILKLIMQEVWKANLSWDELLPLEILAKWEQFYSEIDIFKKMSVPRFINIPSPEAIQLHGFCDASTKAYAAVVYFKSLSNPVQITLVAAKTRIAPLTPITLPRLELCSALLLSELVSVIKEALPFTIQETFLWTDSTVTLCWIQNPPSKGNQFVLHRANKIRDLTSPTSWHHLPGKHNVADCATRGLYPSQLYSSETWWSGPNFILESSNPPTSTILATSNNSPESNSSSLESQSLDKWDVLSKFSSYTKLLRVIGWIQRFVHNTRSSAKAKGPLSATELSDSCKTVVKLVQRTEFATEILMLSRSKPLPKGSKLLTLNIFLDSDSILRVGGRLRKNKSLSFDAKHQLILPKHHAVTSAIIRYFHQYSLHGGTDLVLSLIRQKFWIPDGRSTVKKELRQCITCAKMYAKPITQIMGDLPAPRVTPSRVFQHVGVDYAGPINTKCQHKRKYSTFKSYIALFVCLCTKAVHIELVSDLTTEAFLSTLKRFISRRGCPSDLYSDNGRNFVGASSYIKSLNKCAQDVTIQNYCANLQIQWHFIPPYGPNFGGLWESSIKLAKRHIIKSSQSSLMTFEELTTLLCLVEACLNSRPLTPLSTDPTDLNALTPGHFLIGTPLLQLPSFSNDHHITKSLSLSCRWSHLKQLHQSFWTRWQKEYLNSLSPRQKWKTGNSPLTTGDLVFVKDPNNSPGQWTLARIQDIHPGEDGIIRVVTLKTTHGLCRRPVQQIASLAPVMSPPGGCSGKDL